MCCKETERGTRLREAVDRVNVENSYFWRVRRQEESFVVAVPRVNERYLGVGMVGRQV